MKLTVWTLLAAIIGISAGCNVSRLEPGTPAAKTAEKETTTMITIKTSMGEIKAELFDKQAPETVKNFNNYVDAKFFNDTIFHRVIPGFMIQGGGFTTSFSEKPTKSPVVNEAGNGLNNKRGTLAMARTDVINSATSQFFINLADNAFLDHKDNTAGGFGYCVFGKVTEGLDVIDKIASVKTGSRGPHDDVPVDNVVILSIERSGK